MALINAGSLAHICIDNNDNNVLSTSKCNAYEYGSTGIAIVVRNRVSTK